MLRAEKVAHPESVSRFLGAPVDLCYGQSIMAPLLTAIKKNLTDLNTICLHTKRAGRVSKKPNKLENSNKAFKNILWSVKKLSKAQL